MKVTMIQVNDKVRLDTDATYTGVVTRIKGDIVWINGKITGFTVDRCVNVYNMKYDVIIKDEGEFMAMTMESPKAKEVYESLSEQEKSWFEGDEIKKFIFLPKSFDKIVTFCNCFKLTFIEF